MQSNNAVVAIQPSFIHSAAGQGGASPGGWPKSTNKLALALTNHLHVIEMRPQLSWAGDTPAQLAVPTIDSTLDLRRLDNAVRYATMKCDMRQYSNGYENDGLHKVACQNKLFM